MWNMVPCPSPKIPTQMYLYAQVSYSTFACGREKTMGCLLCRHRGSSLEVCVFLSIFTVHSMMMTDDQIFQHLDKLVAHRGCK